MRILVIRFMAIGDVVITSSLCSSLRKSFPQAEIHYLMHEVSGQLFDLHPDIDKVITLSQAERKNPIKYLRKAWAISRQNYDIIIDTSSTQKSEFISLFSRKTEYRIGREKRRGGFSYSHKVPVKELGGDKISQRMAMLKPLKDAGFDIQEVPEMSLYFSQREKDELRRRMTEQGIDFTRPVFAFSVSSKESQKMWCLTEMCETISHCLTKHNAQIVLYGGLPHERVDIDKVYNMLGQPKDVFTHVSSPSLRELGALLSNCDMFIGNEGGPRHIAHAVGVPSATVFSPYFSHHEWLPGKGKRHLGLEWQDVSDDADQSAPEFEYGDSVHFELYNRIKAKHFIPLVDQVIENTGAAQ